MDRQGTPSACLAAAGAAELRYTELIQTELNSIAIEALEKSERNELDLATSAQYYVPTGEGEAHLNSAPQTQTRKGNLVQATQLLPRRFQRALSVQLELGGGMEPAQQASSSGCPARN